MTTRLVAKALLALAAIPVLAAVFGRIMALAMAVPNAPIVAHLLERPSIVVDRRADNGRVIDADTECIGLSVGLVSADPAAINPVSRAIRADAIYGCDDLIGPLETGETPPTRVYTRYWHGYAAIARPLLAAMPYNDMRGALLTFCAALLALLAWRAGRDFGATTAVAFIAPFVVLNAMGLMVVVTKAGTMMLALAGALYLQRRRRGEAPTLVFFVLGALAAFFDFLTAPALIFALPLLIHCLYADRAGAPARWGEALLLGGFFAAGWAGLILARFALAELALGSGAFAQSLDAALYRFRGENPDVDGYFPGAAILANLKALKSYWLPVAVAAFLVAPAVRPAARARIAALWRRRSGLVVAAIAPVGFIEALSNHAQIHAAFTQVNFAPAFIIAGLALAGSPALVAAGGDNHIQRSD